MSFDELQRLLDKPIEPQAPTDSFLESYRIFTKQAEITKKTLAENAEKIRQVALKILKADPVIPIAVGRSKILSADYLRKGLINLGISVEEPREALDIEKYVNPLPIAISTSGTKKEVNSLTEKFKKYGIKPLVITANVNSDLASYANEEDMILMSVPTETVGVNSYDINQLFGTKKTDAAEELRKYCPLGTLGEWTSHLTTTYLLCTIASELYSIYPSPTLYANRVIEDIYKSLVDFFPIIKRRVKELDDISKLIAESDFFGTVGEEYSSHIVQSFGMRVKQLIPEGQKRKREVYVFNSDKSNPLYSPRFFDKHKNVVILANSGRGSGYSQNIVEKVKRLESKPEIKEKAKITYVGMTFTPNSYIHGECRMCQILPNQNYSLSHDGSTVLRSYEPLGIAFTDSYVPLIAYHQGIPAEKINLALAQSHNKLE
jgi:D-arabinose 5-phosphate isomerase GutQ